MTRALISCVLVVAWCGAARADVDDTVPAATRDRIAAALAREGSPWASTVRDAETTVTRVPTPSELRGTIWRIERFMPTRPLVFYVADGPKGVALVTGKPAAFNAWVREVHANVRRPEEAVALARLFVETTRDTGARLQLVDSVDAVPFRPGLTDAAATARDRARTELATTIRPPHADPHGRGWDVVAFAVAGMDVVKLHMSVARDGAVVLQSEKLRAELPLTYAN